MSVPLTISRAAAQAFVRRAVRLDDPARNVAEALRYHGYVQLDPLNICGRMQDLILRNRVKTYREGDLLRMLHGMSGDSASARSSRLGFEHYIPGAGVLAAWPLEDYRFIRAHLDRIHPLMTRRRLTSEEEELAEHVIREISERGRLMSDDFDHDARGTTGWGTSGRLVKIVLERLFAAGRLLISERRGFRRVYDLPSRVIPDGSAADVPDDRELQRWMALVRLRQRRLVALRRAERELVDDTIQEVRIEGVGSLYCLREDADSIESVRCSVTPPTLLLAPLDPLIYDRKVTRLLWDFDFTWEVYTPPKLRKRGYYSLPVLAGTEIVGDVEPIADRKRRRLIVQSRRVKRGHKTKGAIAELAAFLGLRYP